MKQSETEIFDDFLWQAETVETIYIGLDVSKKRPVVTDRNPHSEGLLDIHSCLYLPSAHEKNQNLPDYLTQVNAATVRACSKQWLFPSNTYSILQDVTMMELPDSTMHTAGVVPGLFLLTPKLTACNIFVAYDSGLHKFFVMRVGGRNPHKPPDLDSQAKQTLTGELVKVKVKEEHLSEKPKVAQQTRESLIGLFFTFNF